MKDLTEKELLEIIDILEDIYTDPQGGIGNEPNFLFPPKKVRQGIAQLTEIIKQHSRTIYFTFGDGTQGGRVHRECKPTEVDEEALAERLVNLSLSIAEQSGDTQRFLKAKRFIEDNLTRQPMVEDVQPVQFLCDDLILKIVEICEEPELTVWKIAKVRELFTQQPVQMDDNFCPECGTEFLSCCKQLLTRKRGVTRDFQRPHAKRLTNLFLKYWYVTHDKSSEESDRIQFWTEANNFIDKMLNELGIEVTE